MNRKKFLSVCATIPFVPMLSLAGEKTPKGEKFKTIAVFNQPQFGTWEFADYGFCANGMSDEQALAAILKETPNVYVVVLPSGVIRDVLRGINRGPFKFDSNKHATHFLHRIMEGYKPDNVINITKGS